LKDKGVPAISVLAKTMERRNAMAKRNMPDPFQIDKIRFQDCFTAPSLRHFIVLMTGWALTVGSHTISQVILTMQAHESEHFASVYRFLSRAKWDPDRVAASIFLFMVETLFSGRKELLLIIDDTLNNHMGRNICGAGYQHDGSAPNGSKKIGYGVCFVIIGLAVRLPGISNRVFCLPYAARLWWPEKTKVRPKGMQYKTKPELASELIALTRSWVRPHIVLRVIVDGGYSNSTLIKNRPPNVHVTGKVRKNATLFAPVQQSDGPVGRGRPRQKGHRLAKPIDMFDHHLTQWDPLWINLYGKDRMFLVHRFPAIWYRVGGNQVLSMMLVWDSDEEFPNTILFDTDIDATSKQIIDRFGHRWSIEITNREAKQLLGSADAQCRCEKSVTRAPLMAYWSYCLVVVWFVTQFRSGKEFFFQRAPWHKKTSITFSDMLAAARRSHFSTGILVECGSGQDKTKINSARSPRRPDTQQKAKL
jgi:hypothetical protein